MKFLIMGCGSIGERHVMNIKSIMPAVSIDIFDPRPERLKALYEKYPIKTVKEEALDSTRYDCVFICTPPVSHIDLAIRALNSGSNVFIEKPLSSRLDRINELQNLTTKKDLLAFVGYNFRFNKGINAVKKMIVVE